MIEQCSDAIHKAGLPVFRHQGIALDYADLRYNPTNDIIVPSVIRTDALRNPLGRYYLYYAPHDAPGGICLAYADHLEGPWQEYAGNPLIARDWQPHYHVSHVSGPHAIWNETERRLFLYFHGENDTTRLATSADGIHFEYDSVILTTAMFPTISEASYARVFQYSPPGQPYRYVMLLMGNNGGTRRIYLAWSRDGRRWEPRHSPLISPPEGYGQVAQAWHLPWRGKHYLIFHAHPGTQLPRANLHACEVDEGFEYAHYLGLYYDTNSVSPTNAAQMSPCIIAEGSRVYLFTNIGSRLNQMIAWAVAEV